MQPILKLPLIFLIFTRKIFISKTKYKILLTVVLSIGQTKKIALTHHGRKNKRKTIYEKMFW